MKKTCKEFFSASRVIKSCLLKNERQTKWRLRSWSCIMNNTVSQGATSLFVFLLTNIKLKIIAGKSKEYVELREKRKKIWRKERRFERN
jgi:hypothetical protein